LGALSFQQSVARLEPPTPTSSSKTARLEALMAARNEGTTSEAQAWEKMAEPPILMGVIGDSVSSPADTG
jgi:hypothetical protein